jgi:RimJ/RimL family protein N-acetyltransferase
VSFAIDVGDKFAGSLDLRFQEGAWAEVGYGLAPWARGRQVMTRALRLALSWGFGDLGLRGVQWRAEVGNNASRRVAEKCGFRVEGTVRGLLFHRRQRVDGWIATVLPEECR